MNKSKRLQLMLIFLLIFHSCEMSPIPAFGGTSCMPINRNKIRLIECKLVGLAQVPPRNLWKGLLREAVGEGYIGMYAVCCVVRNRLLAGMDNGLVGLRKRKLEAFVTKCGLSYELMAKDIVYKVFEQNTPDITNGALYFESIDFPETIRKFDRLYIRCWQYKKHIFWKEK